MKRGRFEMNVGECGVGIVAVLFHVWVGILVLILFWSILKRFFGAFTTLKGFLALIALAALVLTIRAAGNEMWLGIFLVLGFLFLPGRRKK
jgi:hypothetical protein